MKFKFKFKALFCGILIFLLLFPSVYASVVSGEKSGGDVSIYLGSNVVYSKEMQLELPFPPAVLDPLTERTLVSLRALAELLDIKVGWDAETSTASIFNDEKKIYFWVNTAFASIDGEIEMMDIPSVIIDSRIYVPVRYAVERLGGQVLWNGSQRKITLRF